MRNGLACSSSSPDILQPRDGTHTGACWQTKHTGSSDSISRALPNNVRLGHDEDAARRPATTWHTHGIAHSPDARSISAWHDFNRKHLRVRKIRQRWSSHCPVQDAARSLTSSATSRAPQLQTRYDAMMACTRSVSVVLVVVLRRIEMLAVLHVISY